MVEFREEREEEGEEDEGFDEEDRFHLDLFHEERIPIADPGVYAYPSTYIDLYPGSGGIRGQVISLVTEAEFVWMGPSFGEYQRLLLNLVESSSWFYSADSRGLRPRRSGVRVPRREFSRLAREEASAVGTMSVDAGVQTPRTRLELSAGTSNKFWEVEVDGCQLTVRYGRIGTAGRETTKHLDTSSAAARERDRLVAQKMRKGYAPVESSGPAAVSARRRRKCAAHKK